MAFRKGPTPLTPGLDAAKTFDALNAVNRARFELIDALKLLDETGHDAVHRVRICVTILDDARDELRHRPTEPRALLDWLDENPEE